jgi:hypothetical protein
MYNFSYMLTPTDNVYASWYVSDQNTDAELGEEDDNNILLIPLIGPDSDELKKVIRSIIRTNRLELKIGGKKLLIMQ